MKYLCPIFFTNLLIFGNSFSKTDETKVKVEPNSAFGAPPTPVTVNNVTKTKNYNIQGETGSLLDSHFIKRAPLTQLIDVFRRLPAAEQKKFFMSPEFPRRAFLTNLSYEACFEFFYLFSEGEWQDMIKTAYPHNNPDIPARLPILENLLVTAKNRAENIACTGSIGAALFLGMAVPTLLLIAASVAVKNVAFEVDPVQEKLRDTILRKLMREACGSS